jgi:hypothetical protein
MLFFNKKKLETEHENIEKCSICGRHKEIVFYGFVNICQNCYESTERAWDDFYD